MKQTLILSRTPINWRDYKFEGDYFICHEFVNSVLGELPEQIKLEVSSEYEEGWTRIEVRKSSNELVIDGEAIESYCATLKFVIRHQIVSFKISAP